MQEKAGVRLRWILEVIDAKRWEVDATDQVLATSWGSSNFTVHEPSLRKTRKSTVQSPIERRRCQGSKRAKNRSCKRTFVTRYRSHCVH